MFIFQSLFGQWKRSWFLLKSFIVNPGSNSAAGKVHHSPQHMWRIPPGQEGHFAVVRLSCLFATLELLMKWH